VAVGQPLVTVVHRDGGALDEALALVQRGVTVGEGESRAAPLVLDTLRPLPAVG
jgi:hypothetical protein